MRKSLAALAATFTLLIAAPLLAQSNPAVVVELYTSQGCSSCPPADKILHKLSTRDDVIALALHVDYWDYIGWKDTFADPRNTVRQRSYARAAGTRTIYTPQMVIGGKTHVVGNRPMDVMEAVAEQKGKNTGVYLELERNADRLTIMANLSHGRSKAMLVQLVRYMPTSRVDIRRGENAGRTIDYTNVVTEWREIKKWDGSKPLEMNVAIEGSDPVVVIVQAARQGPILAAARLQ